MAWVGECGNCGLCCTAKIGDTEYRCRYLLVFDRLGLPSATACGIHKERKHREPIVMSSANGQSYETFCLEEYPRKQDAVPPECSYKWEGPDVPIWNLRYNPQP